MELIYRNKTLFVVLNEDYDDYNCSLLESRLNSILNQFNIHSIEINTNNYRIDYSRVKQLGNDHHTKIVIK